MLTHLFVPTLSGVRVDRLWHASATVHLAVRATRRSAHCPLSQRRAKRIHSHYDRTLTDLPCGGERVTLHLRVRRFVCRVRWCKRKIFAERPPDLVALFARRTTRLTNHLVRAAFDPGGEAGARHVVAEGTPVSARTLLRLVRAAPLPATGPIWALGVDDWARRKGGSDGTLRVDLAVQRVIALRPDRTAETLAAWLRAPPRGAGRHAGPRRGPMPRGSGWVRPKHARGPIASTSKNVTDAPERSLTRQHVARRRAARCRESVTGSSDPSEDAARSLSREQPARRSRRARYEEVVALHAQALHDRGIAAHVGVSERTAQRWLHHGQFPERRRRAERPGQLAPFAEYLRERWGAGRHNATRLWHELRERGLRGSDTSMARSVAPWRGAGDRDRG